MKPERKKKIPKSNPTEPFLFFRSSFTPLLLWPEDAESDARRRSLLQRKRQGSRLMLFEFGPAIETACRTAAANRRAGRPRPAGQDNKAPQTVATAPAAAAAWYGLVIWWHFSGTFRPFPSSSLHARTREGCGQAEGSRVSSEVALFEPLEEPEAATGSGTFAQKRGSQRTEEGLVALLHLLQRTTRRWASSLRRGWQFGERPRGARLRHGSDVAVISCAHGTHAS